MKLSRGIPGTFAALNENFYAEGMAIDAADNIFLVAIEINDPNFASTIFKFTPDGSQSIFGLVPGQSFGLAFDSEGNLFVACSGVPAGTDTVLKFTPNGVGSPFATDLD